MSGIPTSGVFTVQREGHSTTFKRPTRAPTGLHVRRNFRDLDSTYTTQHRASKSNHVDVEADGFHVMLVGGAVVGLPP